MPLRAVTGMGARRVLMGLSEPASSYGHRDP
jgi:hypothetical protein